MKNAAAYEQDPQHAQLRRSGAIGGWRVADEADRTRLIGEISRVIREPATPESTRTAGLTLIGWLARRMPGEKPHALGVAEARESERRLVTAVKEACPETQASPKSTLRIARRRSR